MLLIVMLKSTNTRREMHGSETLFLKKMNMVSLDCYIDVCIFICYKEVCWVFKGNMCLVKVFKYIVRITLDIQFSHGQFFSKSHIFIYYKLLNTLIYQKLKWKETSVFKNNTISLFSSLFPCLNLITWNPVNLGSLTQKFCEKPEQLCVNKDKFYNNMELLGPLHYMSMQYFISESKWYLLLICSFDLQRK